MAETDSLNFSRGDVLSRKYEIEEKLGSGVLGVTYLARHISSGKHLAIKILRPSLVQNPKDRERFVEAFNSARKIKHEGIVKLGEMGAHEGSVYYTMEYYKSRNLRELMDEYADEQRSFTLQEACQLVLKVLAASEHLHAQDMVHRNIKPENVLIAERRTGPGGKNIVRSVKITDTGMADLINPTIFAENYINRAEARYLAPELEGFDSAGSAQSDVYSAGVILYELLVGQTPRGTYLSPTQLRGDLPDHIDDVVEMALDANAEDRYPTATDMRNDIQRSFSGEVYQDSKRTSFKRVLIGVSIGVLGISAFGIWIGFSDRADPLVNLAQKDDVLRRQVQSQTQAPSESELKAMVEKHPDMLYVPPGPFIKGRLQQESLPPASQSESLVQVVQDQGFYIDRFEFPNRLKDRQGNPVSPVAKVTEVDAAAACESVGKRLCTENEWEKACKGPANWIYSYGDTFDADMCGKGVDDEYVLGSRESCVSGYGALAMSGGLREWTSSATGSKGTRRIVKGGMRANNLRGSRCAFTVDEAQTYADVTLGFRCCADLDAAPAAPEAPEAAPTTE